MRVSNCIVSVCLAGEFLVFWIGGSMLMGGGCYLRKSYMEVWFYCTVYLLEKSPCLNIWLPLNKCPPQNQKLAK